MKRIDGLFDRIISIENLMIADERARQGKKRQWGVIKHDRRREQNIIDLHNALREGRFRTSGYSTFEITKPKARLIFRLPYYPDRILHHAIMNVMEPIWTAIFKKDTYSCIRGRGIHSCAREVRKALRRDPGGTRYCLKLDIRHFYPSIDHGILKVIIRRKIKDGRLLALLDEIIDSVTDGVPIGNYLSQFFANLYLAYFDHWIKEEKRVKYYFRYADDIVILADSKDRLHELFGEIRTYLWDRLRLEIKSNWQIFPVDSRGIDFVGYVFFHGFTRLRRSIKAALCRRAARLGRCGRKLTRSAWKRALAPWWGWMKYADTIHLWRTVQERIPYALDFKRPACSRRSGRETGKQIKNAV